MSDGIPFFNAANLTNLTNLSFPQNTGFGGFNFGSFDVLKMNNLNPQNQFGQGQNHGDNDRNNRFKKNKQHNHNNNKRNNKQGGEDAENEAGLPGQNEEINEDSQNSMVLKATKKIRKQTLNRLQKRAEKFDNYDENPHMNPKFRKGKMPFNKFGPSAGKGPLNPMMFHKTKICPHLIEGVCKRGESCNFAHSQSELKEVPNLKKTRVCQLFQIGKCNMGNLCSFAHGEQELRSTPDFYKTSLCNAFLKGNCKMRDKCRYAHGQDDLRKAGPIPIYTPISTNIKEREPVPVQPATTNTNMNNNNSAANPFNAAAEMVKPSTQPKIDNNLMSGFTMNGLNTTTLSAQPTSGLNSLSNFSINNMPSSFGGFSFGTAQSKAVDNFTPSSVFAQPFNNQPGTKSVEKQPAPQTSAIDNIAFNTFNPDMLASIFNSSANKSFFG